MQRRIYVSHHRNILSGFAGELRWTPISSISSGLAGSAPEALRLLGAAFTANPQAGFRENEGIEHG